MYLVIKVKNLIRVAKQRWGTAAAKQALWNDEFSGGRWNCLEASVGDPVYQYIEKYSGGGSILDLGCGSGSTGVELAIGSYREYTGVDISDVAIEKARAKSMACQRGEKNHFVQGDISSYIPDHPYEVILFRDSIYYQTRRKIKQMIDRCCRYLTKDGVIIMRHWSTKGGEGIMDCLRDRCATIEKYSCGSGPLVAVLRPTGGVASGAERK